MMLKATYPNSVLLVQDMVIAVVTVAALVVGDILILLTTDLVVEALVANLATLIRRVHGRDVRDFKGAKDVKEDVKEDAKDARHHIHLVPLKSARLTTLRSKMNLFQWVKNLNHQSCQKIIT